MSELERLHSQRMAKQAEQAQQPKEHRDPAEWRPKDNRDYERVQANVNATSMRSEPLNYGSLAQHDPAELAGIEAMAKGNLIVAMDRSGLYPDERGIRVRWMLVAEGHGFRMPEGFIHPEAPADVQAEGRTAWKRCVEMASDSYQKFIFAMVWRKKFAKSALPQRTMKILEGPDPDKYDKDFTRHVMDSIEGEIVDAEIVDEE